MALYEYVCRDCDTAFELRRPIGEADRDVTCPAGHADVRRKLSVFAAVGAPAASGSSTAAPTPSMGTCGGCGCR